MKKILVPVDFSEHTNTVCRFALEVAKKTGGEIRLFHAYFDYLITTNSTFPDLLESGEMFNQEMMIEIRNNAKADLENLASSLIDILTDEKITNVIVVHTLTGGMPEDEILNISETYGPELIVMGTHGKGEKELLTGKISSKIVRHAKSRILTIPRNASFRGIENLMYATDFNDENIGDISKLFGLLAAYNPIIHCIHVNVDGDRQADEEKMYSIQKHFNKKMESGKLVFKVIDNEDFVQGINQYVMEHNIDIISVVHRRKGFLKRLVSKSYTQELLVHSEVPLYIFPGEGS
jgi:nucleotide-binding universal stress UspA family protein